MIGRGGPLSFSVLVGGKERVRHYEHGAAGLGRASEANPRE